MLKFPDNIQIENIDEIRIVFSFQVALQDAAFLVDTGRAGINQFLSKIFAG
jgi:hypothetical protein